jgi:hypothetical protein
MNLDVRYYATVLGPFAELSTRFTETENSSEIVEYSYVSCSRSEDLTVVSGRVPRSRMIRHVAYCYSVGARVRDEPLPPLHIFLTVYTVCRTPWAGDQPVASPLPTQENTDTE